MQKSLENCNLGAFILKEKLGEGATGQVWLATSQQKNVAIKLLHSNLFHDSWAIESFERELRATSQLYHPNIGAVHDYGDLSSVPTHPHIISFFGERAPFLILDYIEGASLHNITQPLQWDDIYIIICQVLQALAHAHARNIIHRDIKPSNIIISPQGDSCTLVDFGLAIHTMNRGKGAVDITGTPAYMAPEQWYTDSRLQGPWTDLYSLGCVLWRFITGSPPFGRENTDQVRDGHLYTPLPEFENIIAIPEGIEQWLYCLLSKESLSRYPRAADARKSLESFCNTPMKPPVYTMMNKSISTEESTIKIATLSLSKPRISSHEETGFKGITDVPNKPTITHSQMGVGSWGMNLVDVRGFPCVGRKTERTALWEEAKQCSLSGVRALLLQGVSGVGCSRLAQWLCETLDEEGIANVFSLQLVEHNIDPLASLLKEHFRLHGLSEEQISLHLRTQIQPFYLLEEQWKQLSQWLSGTQKKIFSNPEEKYYLTIDIIRAASSSYIGKQKLSVIYIDDVHNVPSLFRFCKWVLNNKNASDWPILFVYTCLEEEGDLIEKEVSEIAVHEQGRLIVLEPLHQSEQKELLSWMINLSPELLEKVLEKTGGNPKVAREVVREWTQSQSLILTSHGYTLPHNIDLNIPNSIAEIWRIRIRTILKNATQNQQKSLEIAACLGQKISFVEWESILSDEKIPVPRTYLRNLFRKRIANLDVDGWSFRHPVIVDELQRESQRLKRWKYWNQRCAKELQSYDAHELLDRIGKHLIRADKIEEGLLARMQFMQNNADQLDTEDTNSKFQAIESKIRALDIPEDHMLWKQFYGINETRYFMQGNVEGLEKVQVWLDKNLIDPDARARFLQHRCYALHFQNRPSEELIAVLEEGMTIAKELQSEDLEEIFLRFRFETIDSSIEEWEKTLFRARQILESTEKLQKMASWFWEFSWSKYWSYHGEQETAKVCLENSVHIAQQNNRSSHIAISYINLAYVLLEQNDYEEAYVLSQKGYALVERLSPRLMGDALVCKGIILHAMGKHEEGVKLLQSAANPSKIFSHPKAQLFAHIILLELASHQDDWSAVRYRIDCIEQSGASFDWWKRILGISLIRSCRKLQLRNQQDEHKRCSKIFMKWWDGAVDLNGIEEVTDTN